MRFLGKAAMPMLILWLSGMRAAAGQEAPERDFGELEKWLIGSYWEHLAEEPGRDRGDSRDEARDAGRVLARGSLASENLARDGRLPVDLEASDLPRELESRLPPLPAGLKRVLVGDQVALVEKESHRIQDLFDPRAAREKGPPRELAVCHVPPGNASKRRTLTLPEPAIRSHLDHGDYIGRCR